MYSRAVLQVAFVVAVRALPQIALPINSQVPPLARVGEAFAFQFSKHTCEEQDLTLTYSLSGAPAWLSLDDTRTFSGTPSSGDVGPVTFTLLAADDSGTTQEQTTFIVVNTAAPQLRANITDSLAQAGSLSDLTSLNSRAGAAFSLEFPLTSFSSPTSQALRYYATLSDQTPLPSWITFNAAALTFTGTTPPPVPNPQVVSFRLIGSTVAGFAGASFTFDIVISDHTFAFASVIQNIRASPGQDVKFSQIGGQLLLDGRTAQQQDIASANAVVPSWLNFDPQSLSLVGSIPAHAASQDISIRASDIHGDIANTYVHLDTGLPDEPIPLSAPKRTMGPSAGSPAAPTSSSTSVPAVAEHEKASHKSRHGWIAAAVILPVALALALLIWCCRRRRNNEVVDDHEARRRYQDEKMGRRPFQRWHYHSSVAEPKRPAGADVPPLDIRPVTKLENRASATSDLGPAEGLVLDSHQRSSTGVDVAYGSGPSRFGERGRRSLILSPTKIRASRLSRISQLDGNGSGSRRLTGLGHGRFSVGSPSQSYGPIHRRSRRKCNTCGSIDVATLDSTPSMMTMRRSLSTNLKPTIRQVNDEALIERIQREDGRPVGEKRESFLRKRRASRRTSFPKERILSHDENFARLNETLASIGTIRSRGTSGLGSTPQRLFSGDLNTPSRMWGQPISAMQNLKLERGKEPNSPEAIMEESSRKYTSASLESEGWFTSGESSSKDDAEYDADPTREDKRAYWARRLGQVERTPGSAPQSEEHRHTVAGPARTGSFAETQPGMSEIVERADETGAAFI